MLEDERLVGELENDIRTRRVNAEWAVRAVTDRAIEAYKQVSDTYLRERSSDLEDVATRLLTILSGKDEFELSKLDQDVIIVAKNIWPSTVAELDFKCVWVCDKRRGHRFSYRDHRARARDTGGRRTARSDSLREDRQRNRHRRLGRRRHSAADEVRVEGLYAKRTREAVIARGCQRISRRRRRRSTAFV